MKKKHFTQGLLICELIFFLLLAACNDPEVIGLDVQPLGDKLNVSFCDTSTLITYTVREDSIRTDEMALNLLGSYNDPVFGLSSASFYTQFSLPVNNVDFGSGFTPDSLVLSLALSDYYGDLSSDHTIKVFELTEDIYIDSSYYSTRDFEYDQVLAYTTIPVQDGDNLVVVNLNNILTDKFELSNSSNFDDNDAFTTFLKGFYITTAPTPQGSSILYFNLLSSLTKLTLYYHNNTDTTSFDFVIDNSCARINHFEHNYSETAIEHQLNDTSHEQDSVYVQGMSGLKTFISFPYLSSWVNSGKIVVNKAELVLTVEENTYNEYAPPYKLTLAAIDESGQIHFLPDDEIFEGASYFGGAYDSGKNQYTFNIARHIHAILNEGQIDHGLYLLVAGSSVNASRAILKGGGSAASKMKLNLTYTKL
ncbi:MAG: DUF4270 domain-containing protein [Bacteroidota bacterium]